MMEDSKLMGISLSKRDLQLPKSKQLMDRLDLPRLKVQGVLKVITVRQVLV